MFIHFICFFFIVFFYMIFIVWWRLVVSLPISFFSVMMLFSDVRRTPVPCRFLKRALLHLSPWSAARPRASPLKEKDFPLLSSPLLSHSQAQSRALLPIVPSVRAGFPLINHRNRYWLIDRQTPTDRQTDIPHAQHWGSSEDAPIAASSQMTHGEHTAHHALCRSRYSVFPM